MTFLIIDGIFYMTYATFSNQVRRDNSSLKVAILLMIHIVNTLWINKPVMPGSKELKDEAMTASVHI